VPPGVEHGATRRRGLSARRHQFDDAPLIDDDPAGRAVGEDVERIADP
jgi:hypothetical protein